MKRALIVAATGGFLNGFLIPDMKLLQEMGYEVHCAANGNSVSTFVPEERFASIGVTFHQIDFSSTSPISKESLTAYKQYKELLNRYHFDFVHVHTPIPGAIVRMATRRKRKGGCVVVYTTHGLTFPKGSSLKTKIVYGSVEWFCSWMTDGIITINWEDYAQMKKMRCKNVYHINGVGVDEPYIFAYFLGANPEYRKQVQKLAESTGLKIVALRHMDQYVENDEAFGDYAPYDVAPDRFLNFIRGAEYVCTDSFHGTCFSIINEKKFMIFNRYANASATSKNSRIDSLCQNLGVSERRFSGDILEIQKDINYAEVKNNLNNLQQKTIEYLDAALSQ